MTTPCSHANHTLCDLSFTTQDVIDVIKGLDVNKATGPDNISIRLLKETVNEIAPYLCTLFNKSIKNGKFPSEWKQANVVPVHKKDSLHHVENYRPISLLSVVSKIMERCVFNGIKDHVYHQIKKSQHGFIKGRSCVTQLLEVFDIIGPHLDRGGQIDTIYLDMSKAFDKVSHCKLMTKLHRHGFGGSLLQWFVCYLSNRCQRVIIPGGSSDFQPVSSGVPQGSILGPMLFLIFVNDLPESVTRSSVSSFADDTKIFKVINTLEHSLELQTDLNNLNTWATEAGMIFNSKKSKVMRISRKRKAIENTYLLDGRPLQLSNSEKDLRDVWITDNLTWSQQVTEVYTKANKLLGYVRRNTISIKCTNIRRSMYLALVRPHFGYAT